jgi:hypothetical protein
MQASRRRKGPPQVIYPLWFHHAPMIKVTSQAEWSFLKKLFLDSSMHINEESNIFGSQTYLIQPDLLNMFSSSSLFLAPLS